MRNKRSGDAVQNKKSKRRESVHRQKSDNNEAETTHIILFAIRAPDTNNAGQDSIQFSASREKSDANEQHTTFRGLSPFCLSPVLNTLYSMVNWKSTLKLRSLVSRNRNQRYNFHIFKSNFNVMSGRGTTQEKGVWKRST